MILHKLQTLTTVLEEFATSPIPSHIFQVVADFSPALISHDFLAICLRSENPDYFRTHVLAGNQTTEGSEFPVSGGICGSVLNGDGTQRHDRLDGESAETFWQEAKIESTLVTPIRQGEEIIGALAFGSRNSAAFTEDDEALAQALSAAVGSSLQNSRLYQELSDERLTLRAVLQASKDAFLLVNPDNILLMANPAATPLLSTDVDSAPGSPIEEVVASPETANLFRDRRDAAEVCFGEKRVSQATLFPVQSEYGEILGWAAVFRDVTSLKELDAIKSEFVHTVSHDLKGPIGSLMLGIELVHRGQNLTAKQKRQLARMERTMDDMKRLVENLLDLGRLEAGQEHNRHTIDLVELAKRSIENLDSENARSRVDLKIETPHTQTVGDPGQIEQVFNNLLSNSLKYSPGGGTVTITLADVDRDSTNPLASSEEQPDPSIYVFVEDQGIGIPATDIPRLFERFFRSEDTDHRNIPGTGLGLTIVKKIIDSHGGAVRVESEPGQGTMFSFRLPAA